MSRGRRRAKLSKQSSAIVRRLKTHLKPAWMRLQDSQRTSFDDDKVLTSQCQMRKSPRSLSKRVRFDASETGITSLSMASAATKNSVASILLTGHDIAIEAAHFAQRILHIDHLPEWMRADPYINYSYRQESNSFRECFESLFYPHNELMNTWSHLLPAFFFLTLLLKTDYLALYGRRRRCLGGQHDCADVRCRYSSISGLFCMSHSQQCLRHRSGERRNWLPLCGTAEIVFRYYFTEPIRTLKL